MNRKLVFIMLVILAVIGFTFGQSAAKTPFSIDYTSEEVLLLGAGSSWQSCSTQNDFMVENKSGEVTDLMVVLGDQEFMPDRLNANEKKFYSLKGSIASARLQGKKVNADDIPTIINMNPSATRDIRLHCLK